MTAALTILAVAGFVAILLRAGRALLLAVRGGAEGVIARDLAQTRAQRGDITGLQEANVARSDARRRRFIGLGIFSVWVGLLVVPPLTPWPHALYALYSVLWLVPRKRRIGQPQ